MDMKPITWANPALRREIIIRSPSSKTDSANARSRWVSVPAFAVIGSITMVSESATQSDTRKIQFAHALTTASMVRWIPSCTMMR